MPNLSPLVVVISLGQQVKGLVKGKACCKARNYWEEEDGDEESSSPSKIPCLSDGISGEDEKRLKDLFSKLDRNDDGQICIEDLAKSFRELRYM